MLLQQLVRVAQSEIDEIKSGAEMAAHSVQDLYDRNLEFLNLSASRNASLTDAGAELQQRHDASSGPFASLLSRLRLLEREFKSDKIPERHIFMLNDIRLRIDRSRH